jgi:hypothetical protein
MRNLDDGHCDICDVVVADNVFFPTSTQYGPIVITASVCDDCLGFYKDITNQEEPICT